MSNTIGSDGLTDEVIALCAWAVRESWADEHHEDGDTIRTLAVRARQQWDAEHLAHAAEKAAHAETRARAEALDQQLTAVMAALRRGTTIMNGDNHLIAVAKAQQERAEKAEAERDRLRAALELVSLRQESDGPCWCAARAGPHHITCLRARALLGEVKP